MAQDIQQNPPQTDGQEQIVHGLAQSELAGRIKKSSETYNLAQDLEPTLVSEIGREVYNGFEDDDKSRSEWLEKHTFWLSLYMLNDYAQNSDQTRDWGATESVPILLEACDQFQARTFKTFFPNDTFVSAIPMRRGPTGRDILEARAERIGDHMSYQLGFEDRNYKPDKDALFLGVAIHGSFFTKTYFNDRLKRFKVDNVRPTDLVVNYTVGPCKIEDLRRKTHVIYTTVGETETLKNEGYFTDVARPAMLTINNQYNTKVDEISGLTPGNTSIKRDRAAVLLEQHGYFDLDGKNEYLPYIVTICAASRKVLRMTIGWEADNQGNPLKDYKQVQYFTHYKYKENPDGFYGLGLGHTIGDLNSAVNIMLRQGMDAATLANDGNMSGFVSDKLGLEGDEIRLTIGKFTKIPDTVQDMASSLMMMKFPGPNSALLEMMEAMDQRAQRLGSTTEATTGTLDKVVQPTTVLSQIEQALEQFSSVQMRLANSLTDELSKIFRINQRFLPFIDYYTVDGTPESVTRADYADDMLIQPIFDPKYSTQTQKVARAQAELNATLQNPVNQGRPQVIDAGFRRYFEALEVENIDELLPPAPQPQNIDDQDIENMYFLQPKSSRPLFDVFPNQDHSLHMQKVQQLIQQYGHQLQPDQQQDLLSHYQKHQGYQYGQQKGIIPPSPPRSVPTSPLGAGQGNAMGGQPAQNPVPGPQAQLLSQILGGPLPGGGQAAGSGAPPQFAQ